MAHLQFLSLFSINSVYVWENEVQYGLCQQFGGYVLYCGAS